MARGYKLCTLPNRENVRTITMTWITTSSSTSEERGIIEANIVEYAKRNDEFGKLIKEGSKRLNDLKAKLHEANNASCAMRNCLQSIIGFGDNDVPPELKAVTDSPNLSARTVKSSRGNDDDRRHSHLCRSEGCSSSSCRIGLRQ